MSFLFPFVSLYIHSMTHIKVDGREVLIQKKTPQKTWKVSTPILEGKGEFPQEMQELLHIIQQLKWNKAGRFEMDAVIGTIHWTEEIDPAEFAACFPRFLQQAEEWADLLAKERKNISSYFPNDMVTHRI